MKQADLRKHATCNGCNKPIGHTRVPLFWTARIERHFIDVDAIRRHDAFGALLGGALAEVMGPDEELTTSVMDPVTITLCERCAVDGLGVPIAALALC